jgi:hypothetical protein
LSDSIAENRAYDAVLGGSGVCDDYAEKRDVGSLTEA